MTELDEPERPRPTPRPRPSPPPSPTPPGQQVADYDYAGNMTNGFDGSAYTYDAQNRLTGAPNTTFKYDGLNRQVSRTVNGTTTFNVWDGWDLTEEYKAPNNGAATAFYVYGAGGLICAAQVATGQFNYYYQEIGK